MTEIKIEDVECVGEGTWSITKDDEYKIADLSAKDADGNVMEDGVYDCVFSFNYYTDDQKKKRDEEIKPYQFTEGLKGESKEEIAEKFNKVGEILDKYRKASDKIEMRIKDGVEVKNGKFTDTYSLTAYACAERLVEFHEKYPSKELLDKKEMTKDQVLEFIDKAGYCGFFLDGCEFDKEKNAFILFVGS